MDMIPFKNCMTAACAPDFFVFTLPFAYVYRSVTDFADRKCIIALVCYSEAEIGEDSAQLHTSIPLQILPLSGAARS